MYLYELLGWLGAGLIVISISLLVGNYVDIALRHRAHLRKIAEYNETERRR